MVSSFLNRPPARSRSRPLFTTQPPCHSSWSSYPRGYPRPGRVSTLLNHTYSVPGRLVHACLQVTEQVWQPMHLSRFITIAICAMTFIATPIPSPPPLIELVEIPAGKARACPPVVASRRRLRWSRQPRPPRSPRLARTSVGHLLR